MEKKYMERLIGKYCKIVTKEPGEDRASVVTGVLEDVDYQDGFILVDSEQALGCLRINTIVAIKPGNKHKKEYEKRKIVLKWLLQRGIRSYAKVAQKTLENIIESQKHY